MREGVFARERDGRGADLFHGGAPILTQGRSALRSPSFGLSDTAPSVPHQARSERKTSSLVLAHIIDLKESAIMKKAIILTLATAWPVAPAIAGTTDAKDTAAELSVQQNGASAPKDAKTPGSAADKQDDKNKGLSRNSEDCNKACIGGNPP